MRCAEVFVGDGPAYRGFMHADCLSDRIHRQRSQLGDALLKEFGLISEDLPRNALNRLLALLD